MDTSSTPASIPPGFVVRVTVSALLALVPACWKPPTQIVLVVDTNLSKADLDEVKITVGVPAEPVDGSSPDADADAAPGRSFDIPLMDGAPTFPLTLGLEPSGPPGGLAVSVQGLLGGQVVVQQSAVTSFVVDEQKMLLVLLLDTCVGTTCPETSTGQTCMAGLCQSASRDGPLPPWSGATPARPMPSGTVPIGGRTIWANGWHSCANEGLFLYCWGRNTDGEIGDGTTVNAKSSHPVLNIKDPAAVGLGQFASCVCDRAGKAWCWGRNVEGQLGIGTASATSPVPVAVPGINDCVQIAGGRYHTCAAHEDGTVSCWGGNGDGQVGQPASGSASCPQSTGSPLPCVKSPVVVPGLTNVAEVHAGETYTCALKKDMTVWCWGSNSSGTLGDGTNTPRSTPAPVVGLDNDVVEISTGRWFACARHMGGNVSCWGQNHTGQLGDGSMTDAKKPVAVVGITDAAQVGAGESHACVLHGSGLVSCWGDNSLGQLGNPTVTKPSSTPVEVGLKSVKVSSIAVGNVHTCARTSTESQSGVGSPLCWGNNVANQIGDTTTMDRQLPASVIGFM